MEDTIVMLSNMERRSGYEAMSVPRSMAACVRRESDLYVRDELARH